MPGPLPRSRPPLSAGRRPSPGSAGDPGELRVLSLEDEAREEQGLAPLQPEPRSHGSLALAPASLDLDPAASREQKLAALRAHLDKVAPTPLRRDGPRLPTGVEVLDALVGGWPRGAISEVVGRPGTGRLSLLLPALRGLTRGRAGQSPRHVAVVDPVGWLYPPGLDGVGLDHLLLVHPGSRALWAAEQLARAGALPLVVLLDPPAMGRAARRLQHAAEAGDCALVLLHEGAERGLPAALRLEARGDRCFQLIRGGPLDAPPIHLPPP